MNIPYFFFPSRVRKKENLISWNCKDCIHVKLKDLKNRIDRYRPDKQTLPSFLGPAMFRSPNFLRGLKTEKFPDRHLVESWNIPSIQGKVIPLENEGSMTDAVTEVIATLGVPLKAPNALAGLNVYQYFHVSFQSKYLSAYGLPFFMEVFGVAVEPHPVEPGENYTLIPRGVDLSKTPFALYISAATWSNISYPGIGVPLYL